MGGLASTRCVILGGGGFIGTNLCRHLAGRTESLRAFGRRQSFPSALSGIDWIPGDFTDSNAVAAAIAGSDVVFHLVTTSTPASSNVDKVSDLQSNVVSTLNLLETCRAVRVKRVVFISSGGTVYGIPPRVPTPEDSPTDPISAYGISKLAIEKYLALYSREFGIDYRILRVANAYGPYQTALRNQGVIAAFLHRALAGKPIEIWGDGSVIRDHVYVDDVAEALRLAAEHQGSERVFNIGSGDGQSLNQIVELIERLLGRKLDVRRNGPRALDVPVSVLDTSRARNRLGWRPRVALAEGVSRTLDWLRQDRPLAG